MKIVAKFRDQPELAITVDDTTTGRLYFDLTKQQHKKQKPFYKDSITWSPEYMIELAKQAKEAFGWDWLSDSYDLSVTAQLHKDLENSVGKLGFESIPEEYDMLLYDLHHCLHSIQNGKKQQKRHENFQIEWLSDESIPLPEDFKFVQIVKQGELILINPYVGHNPLQIYMENDFSSLDTTCRFHDVIKPGIVLAGHYYYVSKKAILASFQENDPEFVNKHGEKKIKYYSGHAVIGRVDNIKIFRRIQSSPHVLVLEDVEFYD